MAGLIQTQFLNTEAMASARAMRRMARERTLKALGLRKRDLLIVTGPLSKEDEMHFPDEDRTWRLASARCPICLHWPVLSRKKIEGKLKFRAHCETKNCPQPYNTDWFSCSKDAVSVWKMSVLLATK